MVWYLPYLDTAYDVSNRYMSGTVELCFGSLKEAQTFFDRATSSGDLENAELRVDAKGHPRGRLVAEWADKSARHQ